MKTIIIQSRLAPFRIPFFENLGKEVELVVYYGSRSANGSSCQSPVVKGSVDYREFGTLLFFNRLEFNWLMPVLFLLQNCDVVVVDGKTGFITNYFIVLIAKLKRIPVVLWTSGFESPNTERIKNMKKDIETWYFKFIDRFVVYSSHGMNYLLNRGVKHEQIHIAHNSVNTFIIEELHRKLFSAEFRHQYRNAVSPNAENELFVFFVGRLTPSKNIALLLDAFQRIQLKYSHVHLLIAGDGVMKTQLIQHAQDLALRQFHFLGEIADENEINSLFFSSDIFVMPGLGGLALQQAMANGLPCIVSEADGTEKDLISDENGFVFLKDDIESLTDCLFRMIENDDLRSRMGKASKKKIENGRNMNSMIRSFISCMQKAVEYS